MTIDVRWWSDMTIDAAIAKYKDISCDKCHAHCNISCDKCVQESEQLAEWLEELKELRMTSFGYRKEDIELNRNAMYNKAIDDFLKSEDYLMEKIKEEKAEISIDYEWRKVVCLDDIRRMLHQGLLEIAEQLKAAGENEQSI